MKASQSPVAMATVRLRVRLMLRSSWVPYTSSNVAVRVGCCALN